MPATWNTKWGSRRVRHDPPTLAEAIAAAQGMTDDLQGQIQIAAGLMGVTLAEAKAEMQKLSPDRRATRLVAAPARDKGTTRTVVVERKASRRVLAKDALGKDAAGKDVSARDPLAKSSLVKNGLGRAPSRDLGVTRR